jgi:hypothetical protein
MIKLSPDRVCEIAGIERSTLDHWVLLGFITPQHRFSARGDVSNCFFTVNQCLAVAVAIQYHNHGAVLARTVSVLQFLAKMHLEKIEAELQAGRTFPVPASLHGRKAVPGMLIEPPEVTGSARQLMDAIDMKPIYHHVMGEIAKLANKGRVGRMPKRSKRRRRTSLARA